MIEKLPRRFRSSATVASELYVSAGGKCPTTSLPSSPCQTNVWCSGLLKRFHESFCVRNRVIPASRRICGSCPAYPNASGLQNSRCLRPSSRSNQRCPWRNWRTSDSPDGRLQSGSTQLPPTGTNCPASTFSRMRSQRSGLRSLIQAYCCACEHAKRYSG